MSDCGQGDEFDPEREKNLLISTIKISFGFEEGSYRFMHLSEKMAPSSGPSERARLVSSRLYLIKYPKEVLNKAVFDWKNSDLSGSSGSSAPFACAFLKLYDGFVFDRRLSKFLLDSHQGYS